MATDPWSLSTTAASNTTIGGVSAAENIAAANLNNLDRALAAGFAELVKVIGGGVTVGGTGNAITITTGLSWSAYATNQIICFEAGASNTGATTVAVDGLAAKAITDNGGNALSSGDITSGGFYFIAYESGSDNFHLLNPGTGQALANVVEDTTPQLGGDLDVNSNGIQFSGATVTDVTGADTLLVSGTAGTADNFAKWNSDGDLVDGKAEPTGDVVGTSDSQTLTNKTIGAATLSGTMSAADNIIDQPVIQDYGETVNAIGSIGGGTQDIDLESGNVVTGTVDTSTTTFTFSNPPASGTAGSFTLILTNGGSQTVNWPASVDWAGGTAPSLTSSGVDVLSFATVDGGTIWYGFAAGLDMQ